MASLPRTAIGATASLPGPQAAVDRRPLAQTPERGQAPAAGTGGGADAGAPTPGARGRVSGSREILEGLGRARAAVQVP